MRTGSDPVPAQFVPFWLGTPDAGAPDAGPRNPDAGRRHTRRRTPDAGRRTPGQ
ncbi:MAG TPA: hypothetical protein VLW51_12195 [Solirubrobacteraceae bacterium]|nr:hypothetical protein [Solirubrobacteraceae bacterium]